VAGASALFALIAVGFLIVIIAIEQVQQEATPSRLSLATLLNSFAGLSATRSVRGALRSCYSPVPLRTQSANRLSVRRRSRKDTRLLAHRIQPNAPTNLFRCMQLATWRWTCGPWNGYSIKIYVRDADTWKIRIEYGMNY
jgi:hypothetical protein